MIILNLFRRKFRLKFSNKFSLNLSINIVFSLIKCLTFLKPSFWIFFLNLSFFIKSLIFLYNSFEFNFLSITQWSVVSGKPPLFDIIVAQALDDDSKAVLPKGSSHLDGTTAISDLLKNFRTSLWFKKPNSLWLLWLIIGLFLFSSPIENAFHSLNFELFEHISC